MFGFVEWGATDRAQARHMVAMWSRWCAANGYQVAPGLVALANSVRSDQERTALDADLETADHPGMSLALNYSDAGRLMGVSERAVRRFVEAGELPYVEVGGSRRVLREDVESFLRSRRKCRTNVPEVALEATG